jgi:hypothetical protein
MTGGRVVNSTVNLFGGGVFMRNNAVFNMSGGEILDNTVVVNDGGGFFIQGGQLNLSGGQIHNNIARDGGGVAMTGGEVNITGNGVIRNNTARRNGGGIWSSSSDMNISGTGVIHNNEAQRGGGFFTTGPSNTVYTITIRDNTADVYGGGIYMLNTTLTLDGVTVSGNDAPSGGGASLTNSTLYTEGGAFNGNTADFEDGRGGGIYLGDAASLVDLTGTFVINNRAFSGGGIGMVTNNLHHRIFVEHAPLAENAVFNGNRASGAQWYITPALIPTHTNNISIDRDEGNFSMRLTGTDPAQTGFMHHAYNNYDIMYPTDRDDAYPEITIRQWSSHDRRWFYDPANPLTYVTTEDTDGNPWRTEAEVPGVPPTGHSGTTTLTMVIENTGNSVLQNLTFTQDSVTAPLATPWVCGPANVPIDDYLEAITYFMIDDVITCTATVPSIHYDYSFTSVVSVEGEVDYLDDGEWVWAVADDSHIWHAIVSAGVELRLILNAYRLDSDAPFSPGTLAPRGDQITSAPAHSLSPGYQFQYILRVENYGIADATDDVIVVAYIPGLAEFVGATHAHFHEMGVTDRSLWVLGEAVTVGGQTYTRFELNLSAMYEAGIWPGGWGAWPNCDGYRCTNIPWDENVDPWVEFVFFVRVAAEDVPCGATYLTARAEVTSAHTETTLENNSDTAVVRLNHLCETEWVAMQLPFTGGAGPVTWLLLGLAGALGLMLALKKRATA